MCIPNRQNTFARAQAVSGTTAATAALGGQAAGARTVDLQSHRSTAGSTGAVVSAWSGAERRVGVQRLQKKTGAHK